MHFSPTWTFLSCVCETTYVADVSDFDERQEDADVI